MSTNKHIDKICIAVLVVSLLITAVFMNGASIGIAQTDSKLGYENRLFSTDKVHTVDIVMDDWDDFIQNCESEEYSACTVVIDGEKFGNIGLRAKGNTSLSSVSAAGSQRYSFKLEFDQYESGKTYHGLDKLCLNNMIQDNTMMKDYLVYQMMLESGVETPLSSYVYITVNGEDWGLYLAVEGVEDSFLERNYGSDSGDLYKPDSMSNGGGRGNGKDFSMDDVQLEGQDNNSDSGSDNSGSDKSGSGEASQNGVVQDGATESGAAQDGASQGGAAQEGAAESGAAESQSGDTQTSATQNGNGNMPQPPNGGNFPGGNSQNGNSQSNDSSTPSKPGNMPQGFDASNLPEGFDASNMPEGFDTSNLPEGFDSSNMPGNIGGMFGSNDDVKLKYIDDDPDSYPNIFDNAKTNVSKSDKKRLINSLKNLSSYTDIENTVNVEEVLQYFVIHNFVCNGDSYTGMMVHNYYLHESDGQLSMIPWDYNLAFGTFQSGDATGTINTSIDSPVSMGSVDDRPMVGWIFSSEEYTEQYHELFSEFISEWYTCGKLDQLITETADMIRPYVEKDPTKFCTTEEFETGVTAIAQFVSLRGEAVSNQLSGDETQVDASSLNLSDMGTMGSMGGGMGGMDMSNMPQPGNMPQNDEMPQSDETPQNDTTSEGTNGKSESSGDATEETEGTTKGAEETSSGNSEVKETTAEAVENNGGTTESPGQAPEGFNGQAPEGFNGQAPEGFDGQAPEGFNGQPPQGSDGQAPQGFNGQAPQGTDGQAPEGFNGQAPQGFNGQPPQGFNGQASGGTTSNTQ